MPAPWVRELAKLQDSMPARTGEQVREDLEASLGRRVADMFEEFDDTALAAASIAQVHRATLKGGRKVG
jgi:predicted unusual protein kinase regulating ubiquinone biosynthesis (AarF/ABC1/UbiB family)